MTLIQKSSLLHTVNGKIQGHHRDRIAIVYIRQSTLQQVEKHSESTKLQYGLVDKAYELGWSENRVIVIDDDLGKSGSNSEGRPGFQRLVAEVGLDRVGIVLGIEMSRLARSCKDWYQLLEVCALFRTLIGDADGIYDPALYNDRLLLGLKGTMSEAELHVLKQRMIEGKNAKARRGELGMNLPLGYARRLSGEIIKDPDQQAQATISLVFDLFEKFATINAVLKYLVKHKIQMPYRENTGLQKGELVWRRPNRPTLNNVLHNPIYAGAYVYGRRPTDPRKKKPGRPSSGRTVAKPSEWAVVLKDKIPAYITWEQFERNQRQMMANNNLHGIGAPREGKSLLSGLIICGHCGLRMMPTYTDNGNKLRYSCSRMAIDYGEPLCQSLAGNCLDALIEKQVFLALQPSALEISLQVADDIEKERKGLLEHWKNQLERAHYQVERAYRQYNSVEPENRLVVRTLEKQWEEALLAEEKVKKEYNEFLSKQPAMLSIKEREEIRKLASDIPNLWSSPTTTTQERKEIVRLLIERVLVRVEGQTEKVLVEIHWLGGHITHDKLNRPVAKLEQLSYYNELKNRAEQLRLESKNFREIALVLNQEGWKPAKKEKFNEGMVGVLLARKGVKSDKKTRSSQISKMNDEWTIKELSQEIKIPEPTIYKWLRIGVLQARRCETSYKGVWLITANKEEIKRLQDLRNQPKEWIHRSRVKRVE
jgi:DNA invertase Pin-like site-specific DNA recombinase